MEKNKKEIIKRNGINTARYIAMDTWSEDMEGNALYMFHQQRMIDEEIAELRKRGECDKKRNNYQNYKHEMIYLTAMSSEYKRLGEEYQQKCAGEPHPAANNKTALGGCVIWREGAYGNAIFNNTITD